MVRGGGIKQGQYCGADVRGQVGSRFHDAGELAPKLRPYPADAMRAYPVGVMVNDPRNDAPECLAPAL